ncbi:MAG: UbiA prenyltransferase family protein [Bacillota bacterium]
MVTNIKHYIQLIRPHQYSKNLFMFLPAFFALKIADIAVILKLWLAFAIFSLIASTVYVINDIRDIEYDKEHPIKRNRPLASGKIQVKHAAFTAILFALTGFTVSVFLNMQMFYLVVLYFILNILYSVKLKHIAIVDICIIAVGFCIRVFVGGVIADVELSEWIILMTFLLAVFLALAKRRDDVLIFLKSGDKPRKNIDGYNLEFIDASMIIMASVVIVSYIMYSVSFEVTSRLHTDKLYITVLFVILGILRYLQITFVENRSGSPTEIFLKDRFIQFSVAAWLLTFGVVIYNAG